MAQLVKRQTTPFVFHYQQTNNAHLSIHQNQHNTTYEALNNSNDLVYLSSPPPSNSINPNKFHQQKQTFYNRLSF